MSWWRRLTGRTERDAFVDGWIAAIDAATKACEGERIVYGEHTSEWNAQWKCAAAVNALRSQYPDEIVKGASEK